MKDETVQEMTQEERLTAIAYQFVQLYERWSEDRQVAAKQGADIAEFVKLFAEQVENFEALETNVRKTLITSIQGAMTQSAKAVGDEIRRAANQTLEEVNQRLLMTVGRAEKAIDDTQRHAQSISWFAVMGLLVLPIITSLLIVWLLVPKPTLPLTNGQLNLLSNGYRLNQVWDKLSKKEQDHLLKLSDDAQKQERQQQAKLDSAQNDAQS